MSDRERPGLEPECDFDLQNPDLYEKFIDFADKFQDGQHKKYAMDGWTIDLFMRWIEKRGGKIEYGEGA